MGKRLWVGLMLLGFCTAGVDRACAQETGRGEVRGVVRDEATGEAVAQVNLSILREGVGVAGTVSDAAGRYVLTGLAYGQVELVARFVGYTEVRDTLHVGPTPLVHDLYLARTVIGLDEVEVTADQQQAQRDVRVSLGRVTPRQALTLAGGGEDVMRALQMLPGVVSTSDYANRLIVRGGTPDQNLILLDDIEVFSPYQLHGMGSLINPATVRQVELYAGAFPAAYGDRLSSVLAVETRTGAVEAPVAGQVSANLSTVNGVLEGRTGFWDGAWLVSGRRTYFDAFANTFAQRINIFNEIAFPDFYDGQFKVVLRPRRAHQVSATGLYSEDVLNYLGTREDPFGAQGDTGNLLDGDNQSSNAALGLTWTYAPHEALQVKAFANTYRNRGASTLRGGLIPHGGAIPALQLENPPPPPFGTPDTVRLAYGQDYQLRKTSAGLQGTVRRGRHTLEGGGSVDFLENRLDLGVELNAFGAVVFDAMRLTNPQLGGLVDTLDQSRTYERVHVYVQDHIALGGGLYVQPGGRYDYYGITGRGYVSPRLAASLALTAATTLRAAGGRYLQSPGFEKLLAVDNLFNLARYRSLDSLDVEKAWHVAVGLSHDLGRGWHVRVEGYHKWLDDLIVQASRFVQRPVPEYQPHAYSLTGQLGRLDAAAYTFETRTVFELTPVPINDAEGRAYGVEVLLEKRPQAGPWTGWLSYAYAHVNRTQDVAGLRIQTPFEYDRRHALNLMASRRLGPHLEVGATWRFGTGFPYTPPVTFDPLAAIVDDPATGTQRGVILTDPDTDEARLVPGYGGAENVNTARYPDYHRLDVRITYARSWPRFGYRIYLDLINLYNRRNVATYQYVVVVRRTGEDLPLAIRPPPVAELFREPVYMFPFIPSFGLGLSF